MTKKRVFGLLLLGALIGLIGSKYYRQESAKPFVAPYQKISPANTVFAFDLHGVVLEPRIMPMIKYMWRELPIGQFMLFIINPLLWKYVKKFITMQVITEQDFNEIVQDVPSMEPFRKVVLKINTSHRLNEKTVDIIKQLKNQGYTIYVLSNIWASALTMLLEQFPEFKSLFNGFYVPAVIGADFHKPELLFYEKFKEYVYKQEQQEKQIVFFDNAQANIDAAHQSGMMAYSIDDLEQFFLALQKNTQLPENYSLNKLSSS